ncbi:hypothetical protein HMPREF6485_2498 [Segatella buccae ATCC 33574]|uniref:Uncharacterized protein n=1 Tax=Segatella buccae ATCC 33574 TaxID=873513 RepID=E6KA62_9BACT|nr:hypothetical protein HMPREF6485_2498 [Segatella buccae ATCC 33574]
MMLGPKQRFGLLNGKRKRAQEKLIKPSNSQSLRDPQPLKGAAFLRTGGWESPLQGVGGR